MTAYAPYLLKIATRLKALGANTKIIFGTVLVLWQK
jgi:hypothetical protein